MSDNTNTNASIDDLLDSSIDDLADMPEFGVYPTGAHKVIISFERKEVNKHPAIEMRMKAIETVELANPAEDKPLEPGAESSVLFMLDNPLGQGKLKTIMKSLSEQFGTSSIKDTMEAGQGAEVVAVTKVRQNKEKTQSYTDVTKVYF